MHGVRMHYRLKNEALPLLTKNYLRWQWVSEAYGILWFPSSGDAKAALAGAKLRWDSKSVMPYMV